MIRIGISGWRYEPWRGIWYPEGVVQRRELEFCGYHFPTVEINGSFYSLQRPESYETWYRATPSGFVFAVKGSRYVTHFLRLQNVERPLANFFASGVFALREKLGPFLWQLPPMLTYDRKRLEAFFRLLPRSTMQALALARRRDARMTGRAQLAINGDRRLRHAIEVRHDSFVNDEFRSLAKRHGIAIVVADTAGKWPMMLDAAADFVYVRLHGDVRIYTSGYSDSALAGWTRRIRRWARDGRDVYVYFDNDVKVRAPFDALALMRRLGCAWPPGTPGENADLPRHAPDARIPRVSVGYGPRVTGGGAWVALRRGGSRQLARGASLTVSGRPTSRAGGRTARRSSSTGRMFSTSRAIRRPPPRHVDPVV